MLTVRLCVDSTGCGVLVPMETLDGRIISLVEVLIGYAAYTPDGIGLTVRKRNRT